MENSGNGYFDFNDSMYFENGFPDVNVGFYDDNDYIDIFSRTVTTNPYTINISVVYNYGLSQFDSIKSFSIYPEPPVPFITSGDVNGDGFRDLLFAHNNDFLWGIIYNDGSGNFTDPEYYDLTFPPVDITCDDLNEDGREDVLLCGTTTEIYFSTETGFQQLVLTTTLSHDVLISDFDNDGDNDVITHTTFVYPSHRVYFFENLGNNQFLEHDYFQFSPFCQYGHITDFDNDSLPDMVFCAHDNSGLHIYYNQGEFLLDNHKFIPVETNNAMLRRVDCADFDGNTYNDIVLIKSWGAPYEGNAMFLFNDGQGNFVDNPITSIQDAKVQTQNINCYPNPFTDNINFKIETKETSNIILSIYDLQGNVVYESTKKNEKGGLLTITWDGKNMFNARVDKGTYIAIVFKDGAFYRSVKLIKY